MSHALLHSVIVWRAADKPTGTASRDLSRGVVFVGAMRLRHRLALVTLTLATALLLTGPAASADAKSRRGLAADEASTAATSPKECRTAGATVMGNRLARVYRVRRPGPRYSLFGCIRASGRRTWLGIYGHLFEGESFARPEAIRLTGTYVALDVLFCRPGGGGGCSGTLFVHSLRRGSERTVDDRNQEDGSVTALVLTPSGAAAWIRPKGLPSPSFTVRKLGSDARTPPFGSRPSTQGSVLLDSGPDIDPRSLIAGNGAVSWRRAGQEIAAPLR